MVPSAHARLSRLRMFKFKLFPEILNFSIIFRQIFSDTRAQVLLAVGGWMVGPAPFKELTENVYRQTLFTFSTIEYLRENNFDGLDLCWEFPRGTEDKDR